MPTRNVSQRIGKVGVNALAVLYDEWPENAASLALPVAFDQLKLASVAWYAAMRERFPGKRNFAMFLAGQPDGDLEYVGATLRLHQDLRDYLMSKWPNRGDSVLLDCLFWPPQKAPAKKPKVSSAAGSEN